MIDSRWYKNAVFYSLDLETFMDANRDGVGDFSGLIKSLDYLHSLGVDAIWLAPFQPTPNKDNGYDIKDYYGVDPRHGSSGDFAEFMHAASNVGIKVVIDLVVNHTSDEHPWFKEARKDKNSPYRHWYVWADEKPEDWDEGMVFPGVQKSVWTHDEKAQAWYFHRFYDFQPDLNISNPEVQREIHRILGFWLSLGVAGFRVDALPFILETQGPGIANNRKTQFEFLEALRRFMQWRKQESVLLGEANVAPDQVMPYFGAKGEGLQMMFNFYVNQYMFLAMAEGRAEPLRKALEQTCQRLPEAQWAHFLRNHDELDLGRLSEEERQKVFDAFGPEESMQLYGRGIRRRLAPMLGSRQRYELAHSLMLSLPGTPVIRYGDEIGMGDRLDLEERQAVRTPMQWNHREHAGFSATSSRRKLIHPLVEEGPYAYQHINVEAQMRQDKSLLNWMRQMLRLRKECPEIGYGRWESLELEASSVLGLYYDYEDNCLLTLHNLIEHPVVVELSQKQVFGQHEGECILMDLRDPVEIEVRNKRIEVELGAFGYRWLRVQRLPAKH